MRPLWTQESSKDLHGDKRPGSSQSPLLWGNVDPGTQHLLVETLSPAPTLKVLGHVRARRGRCQGGLTSALQASNTPDTKRTPRLGLQEMSAEDFPGGSVAEPACQCRKHRDPDLLHTLPPPPMAADPATRETLKVPEAPDILVSQGMTLLTPAVVRHQ